MLGEFFRSHVVCSMQAPDTVRRWDGERGGQRYRRPQRHSFARPQKYQGGCMPAQIHRFPCPQPRRRSWATLGLGAVLCVLSLWPAPFAAAGEPADEFLQALRTEGYFDTALEFLAQMETSPLAPIAFKQVIPYERGLTLVSAASVELDTRIREQMLNDAEQALTAFIQKDPNHRMVPSARNQLGNLLYLRGNFKVELSKRNNDAGLLTEARRFYDEGYQVFGKVQQELKAKLDVVNSRQYDASQREEEELRDQMRRDYLQAQLLAAQVLEERAETLAKGSPEYLQVLTDAEKQYQEIEKKYTRWAAGLYARMALGRCLQKRDKYAEALGFYTELLDAIDTPELRGLRTDTMELAMECWLHPDVKLYAEAISRGTAWQTSLRPYEARTPQALGILLNLAKAHQSYAEFLKQTNPKDRQINELLRTARNLAVEVSRYPSDAQDAARQFIADLRGVEVIAEERPQPKTFSDAKTAGKESLDQMQNATFLVDALPARLAQETDPQLKTELQAQLDEAQQNVTGKRDEAIDYYRLALALANKDTPLEDLNLVRMTLAHLLYLQGEFYDSALVAEFVTRKYPAQLAAREAAKIGLAAYVQLYSSAPEDARQFEANGLRELCDYIVKQWPDQPVAADAWNALIPFIVKEGDFARAQAGIATIPETAPQRGEVELKIGRALWGAYRQGMADLRKWERDGVPAGVDVAQTKTQLEEWKTQAQQILSAGLDRVRANSAKIDASLMLAALSMAQVYVETQQAAKAVELLEDPSFGPLTLARAQNPVTQLPGLTEETYRTGLRAYLASLAGGGETAQAMQKAKDLMAELKTSWANDPQGQQRLIATYLGLARDLKSQMEIASFDERKSLSQGFELFLSQVSKESDDFQVLNWAGETFYGLAESFDDTSTIAPVTANGLYKQALTVFQKIADLAAKQANFLPTPQYMSVIDLRIAMCNRRIGDYNAAINTFVKILTEKNMTLNVQVEAARTFQQWASAPGKHDLYQRAMLGYFPDKNASTPSNIIWGWGKIGKMTAGRKEFEAAFFESRYELARCRFEYARQIKDDASQKRYIELAKQDIWYTYRLYPQLGGQEWSGKYDALLKQIQQARGEKADGLAEFQRQLGNAAQK